MAGGWAKLCRGQQLTTCLWQPLWPAVLKTMLNFHWCMICFCIGGCLTQPSWGQLWRKCNAALLCGFLFFLLFLEPFFFVIAASSFWQGWHPNESPFLHIMQRIFGRATTGLRHLECPLKNLLVKTSIISLLKLKKYCADSLCCKKRCHRPSFHRPKVSSRTRSEGLFVG